MNKAITVSLVVAVFFMVIFSGWLYNNGTVKSSYDNGYNVGFESGYQVGLVNGSKLAVGSGYNLRNPTYQEALTFIANDNTEQKTYDLNSYVCFNFASDVIQHAYDNGLKAGFAFLTFEDSDGGHAVVCFDTIDRGRIYVEPQTDDVVTLSVGQPYENVALPNPIVSTITVIW